MFVYLFIVSRVPSAFYGPVPPPVPTPILRRSRRNRAPAPPPLAPVVRATRPTGTRVRARAAAGGGRGRAAAGGGGGRGRAAAAAAAGGGDPGAVPYKSYGDPDVPNPLPELKPTRIPGIHFERRLLRNTMTKAIDFFKVLIELYVDLYVACSPQTATR